MEGDVALERAKGDLTVFRRTTHEYRPKMPRNNQRYALAFMWPIVLRPVVFGHFTTDHMTLLPFCFT